MCRFVRRSIAFKRFNGTGKYSERIETREKIDVEFFRVLSSLLSVRLKDTDSRGNDENRYDVVITEQTCQRLDRTLGS